MKVFIISVNVLFMSLSGWAAAGNDRGNGGDVLVLRDSAGSIVTEQLMDYYEGENLRHIPHVFETDKPTSEYLQILGQKLAVFDQRLSSFPKESIALYNAMVKYRQTGEPTVGYLFSEQALGIIDDTGDVIYPPGYKIEQFVVRLDRRFDDDPYFKIQGDILRKLSEDDLRGIVIHEVIYKHFVEDLGVANSIAARYFNQIFTSKKLLELVFSDYANVFLVLVNDLFQEGSVGSAPGISKNGVLFHFDPDNLTDSSGESLMWTSPGQAEAYVVVNTQGEIDEKATQNHGFVNFMFDLSTPTANEYTYCASLPPAKISVSDVRDHTTLESNYDLLQYWSGCEMGFVLGYGEVDVSVQAPVSDVFQKCGIDSFDLGVDSRLNTLIGPASLYQKTVPIGTKPSQVVMRFKLGLDDQYRPQLSPI